MRELLKEKEKLEDQVNQLKWDIDNVMSQNKKYEQESSRLQKENDRITNDKKALSARKDTEVEQLENQLHEKDQNMKTMRSDKEKHQKAFNDEKVKKDNITKILDNYKGFAERVCNYFDYDEAIPHTGESDDSPLLEGFFNHLAAQNVLDEKVLLKAEEKIKELRDSLHNRSEAETTTEQYNEMVGQLQAKEDEVRGLNDQISIMKVPVEEEACKDCSKYLEQIQEKNGIISNHASTLENMRSSIVKIRDNLQSAFDELKVKDDNISTLKDEIVEQKLSLISTINSELSSVG
jgi:chromosome segregation ATPase